MQELAFGNRLDLNRAARLQWVGKTNDDRIRRDFGIELNGVIARFQAQFDGQNNAFNAKIVGLHTLLSELRQKCDAMLTDFTDDSNNVGDFMNETAKVIEKILVSINLDIPEFTQARQEAIAEQNRSNDELEEKHA